MIYQPLASQILSTVVSLTSSILVRIGDTDYSAIYSFSQVLDDTTNSQVYVFITMYMNINSEDVNDTISYALLKSSGGSNLLKVTFSGLNAPSTTFVIPVVLSIPYLTQ